MNTEPRSAPTPTPQLIPGAYERNTLTHRQLGSMGGPAFGSEHLPSSAGSMSAATIADREREGGGALSQRRHARQRRAMDARLAGASMEVV
jgi:hypothetical protein